MDIFVLLLIAILVYLLPENNDYLGVKSTSGLKGFLACLLYTSRAHETHRLIADAVFCV